MTAASPASRLRLLQLASPALPIGGYSYSSGLETAIDTGRVTDFESAARWIGDILELVLARFEGPVTAAAHAASRSADPIALRALNRAAVAARETAELRLESEQMGFSLSKWADAVLGEVPSAIEPAAVTAAAIPSVSAIVSGSLSLPISLPISLPVAWGHVGACLELPAFDTVIGYFWSFAENQVLVLLKAMPIGQMQGQRLLHSLAPVIERSSETAVALAPSEWSSAAAGLAIASMRHETQYSRLFRS